MAGSGSGQSQESGTTTSDSPLKLGVVQVFGLNSVLSHSINEVEQPGVESVPIWEC